MVLIDMEMPKSCFECPACQGDECWARDGRPQVPDIMNHRASWCPIKPFTHPEPQIATKKIEQSEMKSVNPGEPILVLNKNAFSFEVCAALTFKKDGKYLVTVSGNKITVYRWGAGMDTHRCPYCGAKMDGGVNDAAD